MNLVAEIGNVFIFLMRIVVAMVKPPYRFGELIRQMEFVGVGSLPIIILTGTFTGAVFTLQLVQAMAQIQMESSVGSTVMLAISRELGPVLTSLMVTGRVGSSMATELGTMRVTEQIDAMEVMAVDPVEYLVVPRVLAGTIMLPALVILFDAVAAAGSALVAITLMGVDEGAYWGQLEWFLDPYDFTHGVYKAFVFGTVLTLVGCYKGFYATGGAKGVGEATTKAVVIGSISVFFLDYLLTTMML
ncbi:ABC transporter permease [Myxococcota bacterium]|nr:ABC transporter permease [Myxococcota bacterium]